MDQNQQKRAKQAVEELLSTTSARACRWPCFASAAAVDRPAVHERPRSREAGRGEGGELRTWPSPARHSGAAQVGETLASDRKGRPRRHRGPGSRKIIRHGDRLLRRQEGSPLYFLWRPRRRAPPGAERLYARAASRSPASSTTSSSPQSRPTAHAAFYPIDVGGLAVESQAEAARDVIDDIRADSVNADPLSGAAPRARRCSSATGWRQARGSTRRSRCGS
jgi:hypothetical protein